MQFPRPNRPTRPTRPLMHAALACAATCGAYSGTAQASYFQPSVTTSAVACNTTSPSQARPTRNFGARNYQATPITVTCPISRPDQGAPVYGLMVYGGSLTANDRVDCVLLSTRKHNGDFVAVKTFTVNGKAAGAPGTWVFLEPAERAADAVQEVQCTLPASNRAWLIAFEAFAG